MVWLIDSNVVLDYLQDRMPFADDACAIWKMCESRKVKGCISVLTFADIVYIMRKWLDASQIEQLLTDLSGVFSFVSLTEEDIGRAASLHWKDYEDAIQAVTAERLRCDAIITRNTRDFMGSVVPAVTPKEILEKNSNA